MSYVCKIVCLFLQFRLFEEGNVASIQCSFSENLGELHPQM